MKTKHNLSSETIKKYDQYTREGLINLCESQAHKHQEEVREAVDKTKMKKEPRKGLGHDYMCGWNDSLEVLLDSLTTIDKEQDVK